MVKIKKRTAVTLDLKQYRYESVSESSLFIIDKYRAKPCSNLREFKDFINNKDKVYYNYELLQIKLIYLEIP